MAPCPAGHESGAADYCDVCGMQMNVPVAPSAFSAAGGLALGQRPGSLTSACPQCGTLGLARFCEQCGFGAGDQPTTEHAEPPKTAEADSTGLRLDQSAAWTAVVTASRAYYDAVMASAGPDASQVSFPDHCPERRFSLLGNQMRIGRRSRSKEVTPEIDLTGPPADPGVSRLHAILLAQPDGSWAVMDPGSENGTTVNDSEIPAGQPVPLGDGDTICVGAWTAIVIVVSP